MVVYRADAATCNACPVKAACTESAHGRIVHRSFYADYLERVRGYHATEAYQKAMRKRQVWVEPLFAEAKDWHGLRRFRLRGLTNANIEGLLIAAGQNLKRFLAATGWGRRHAPCGSLLALPGARSALSRLQVIVDPPETRTPVNCIWSRPCRRRLRPEAFFNGLGDYAKAVAVGSCSAISPIPARDVD